MTIVLDHVSVPARDRNRSARFFADLLGVAAEPPFGPWAPVRVSDSLALLFHDADPFAFGHYAFVVDTETFESVIAFVRDRGVEFGSAPGPDKDGRVSAENGARRVYVRDPDGNSFEFMTQGSRSHT